MRVIATQTGFFAGSLREKGTTFEVPDSFKASWVAPLGSPAAEEAKPKPAPKPRARALSELAKPGKSFIEQNAADADDLA